MTAPTETEIREAIHTRLERYPNDDPRLPLREAIEGIAGLLTGPAYEALLSPDQRGGPGMGTPGVDLWEDLRPSEAIVLTRHAGAAIEVALASSLALIIEEVVKAAMAAAAEIPDAPRAGREADAA